jgi:hypothetical protein
LRQGEKGDKPIMSKVEEIKAAIEALPERDYAQLRQWFTEKEWASWDARIKADSELGKLDFLVTEAFGEKKKGTLKEL